ncbi:hypothetical protein PHYBOEH_007459 [Phytophthora boehmeriae]|uniref:Uncharacterized protein n=1 Tax=Phytophthora boehmeriae TaxID=109152 RepID=A0A8T1X801_9STRA|nr:hypothetical protein PHYBOEH_007459 [Phytophthora boehmeriae]
MSTVSKHFVAEKIKALCVVSDVRYASETLQDDYEVLPLVATGGWDNEINHVTLHLPVRPTHDERELRREFGHGGSNARPCELSTLAEAEHVGDVNALQFVSAKGENLLLSASSVGGVFAYRVAPSAGDDDAMSDSNTGKPLSSFAVPEWEKLFLGTAATCLEASESRTTVVTASAGGALAWLKLDESMGVEKIENKNTSRLPINAVKFLGQDSVVATVGSTPGSQLRIWDLTANNQFPITSCSDPSSRSILTTLETHPTRPELLITGANDGRVSFWDRRHLDAPFRTEAYHQRAIRALKLHSSSPRFLYTAGDDSVVNCWDFHYGRNPRESVEYERYSDVNGAASRIQSSASVGALSGATNGFNNRAGGLQVRSLVSSFEPWNALAVHGESDTLVAGSDSQSVMIVQQVSKWK